MTDQATTSSQADEELVNNMAKMCQPTWAIVTTARWRNKAGFVEIKGTIAAKDRDAAAMTPQVSHLTATVAILRGQSVSNAIFVVDAIRRARDDLNARPNATAAPNAGGDTAAPSSDTPLATSMGKREPR